MNLREYRKNLGLTLEEAQALVGINRDIIRHIEIGEYKYINEKMREAFREAYGKEADSMIAESYSNPPKTTHPVRKNKTTRTDWSVHNKWIRSDYQSGAQEGNLPNIEKEQPKEEQPSKTNAIQEKPKEAEAKPASESKKTVGSLLLEILGLDLISLDTKYTTRIGADYECCVQINRNNQMLNLTLTKEEYDALFKAVMEEEGE